MDAQLPVIWKTVIVTAVTQIMSNIIPIDLSVFATNPNYLSTLFAANASKTDPAIIELLAYDENFVNVVGENAQGRQLYNYKDWQPFHEAGVYNKGTNKLYVTSNYAGSTDNPINVTVIDIANNYSISTTGYASLAEGNGATSYFPPGTERNGSTPSRVLYCDEGDFHNYSALVSVDPATGESEHILNNYMGRNFSSINDARQHPITGDVWFTDADYGYYQYFRPVPTIPKQVYRFSPSTGEIAVVADGFSQCNGIEFSPDLKTLYIADTGTVNFDKNFTRPSTIYAFDISEDHRTLSGRRTFAYVDNGYPDGIHCDTEGNLWAGCGDGIHVFSPAGKLLGKVWTGLETNNFAFLPGAVMVFTNAQLWIVENLKAVGREISKDFGI